MFAILIMLSAAFAGESFSVESFAREMIKDGRHTYVTHEAYDGAGRLRLSVWRSTFLGYPNPKVEQFSLGVHDVQTRTINARMIDEDTYQALVRELEGLRKK